MALVLLCYMLAYFQSSNILTTCDVTWFTRRLLLDRHVMDVSVEFSVYKNPYNNYCQMSFSLSQYIKIDVGGGFDPYPTGELTALPTGGASALPQTPSWFQGVRFAAEATGGKEGEGREGLEAGERGREGKGGMGKEGKRGKLGGIAPWKIGAYETRKFVGDNEMAPAKIRRDDASPSHSTRTTSVCPWGSSC